MTVLFVVFGLQRDSHACCGSRGTRVAMGLRVSKRRFPLFAPIRVLYLRSEPLPAFRILRLRGHMNTGMDKHAARTEQAPVATAGKWYGSRYLGPIVAVRRRRQ